jgi:hypothetical protein
MILTVHSKVSWYIDLPQKGRACLGWSTQLLLLEPYFPHLSSTLHPRRAEQSYPLFRLHPYCAEKTLPRVSLTRHIRVIPNKKVS